jgi:hypothetical protein
MTKAASFKRAVRSRARQTGQKYTTARSAMESDDLRKRISRPVQHEALKVHLEKRYGIRIARLAAFDGDHPATLRLERAEGMPWVARVFTSTADLVERVEGDAEILRWLQSQGYPAERLAHPEPVSLLDGSAVMVTELVPGARPAPTPPVQAALADLLGRLHSMRLAAGATTRDGGSFDHDAAYYGRPSADVAASLNFLRTIEGGIDPARRDKFEWLLDQVSKAEDCEGLPEAFTHGNYGPFNAIQRSDGKITVVGWAASGRAPRLATLGWHLYGTGGKSDQIDAIVRGYSRHVRLTEEELERLPGAVLMRALYLACWYYWTSVSTGYTPSGGEGWWPDPERAGRIASYAVAGFRELTPLARTRNA